MRWYRSPVMVNTDNHMLEIAFIGCLRNQAVVCGRIELTQAMRAAPIKLEPRYPAGSVT